nr:hypothetical protein [Streptomyces buecherae]
MAAEDEGVRVSVEDRTVHAGGGRGGSDGVGQRTISPALDADASDEAWEWLYEDRVHTRRALLQVQPCTVSVTHADTRITWTIRPVLFLPLAHRQATELPACAHDFKSRQTD